MLIPSHVLALAFWGRRPTLPWWPRPWWRRLLGLPPRAAPCRSWLTAPPLTNPFAGARRVGITIIPPPPMTEWPAVWGPPPHWAPLPPEHARFLADEGPPSPETWALLCPQYHRPPTDQA